MFTTNVTLVVTFPVERKLEHSAAAAAASEILPTWLEYLEGRVNEHMRKPAETTSQIAAVT